VASEDLDDRPAMKRDQLFYSWTKAGLGNAAIRDKWNRMSDAEREAACPKHPQRIGDKKDGADAVRKAITRVKREMKHGKK
jgi:hypothetical protein